VHRHSRSVLRGPRLSVGDEIDNQGQNVVGFRLVGYGLVGGIRGQAEGAKLGESGLPLIKWRALRDNRIAWRIVRVLGIESALDARRWNHRIYELDILNMEAMMGEYRVFCCNKVSWSNHYGVYWLELDLQSQGTGVGASFDSVGLWRIIDHCNVSSPEQLRGLLFEVRFDNDDGGPGSRIDAIRIHPSYGKTKPWLRANQVVLAAEDERNEIIRHLERF